MFIKTKKQSKQIIQDPSQGHITHAAVIYNPASGRGQNSRCLENAVSFLQEWFLSLEVYKTTAPGEAEVLARKAVHEGAQLVIAAGGDGTLGEVARGILQSGAKLGILPFGTGNDFARAIGIGSDLETACMILSRGKSRKIDLGTINDIPFINIAGCGFDAHVAHEINTGFKYLKGTTAYIAAVMKSLVSYKPKRFNIKIKNTILDLKTMLVSVGNGSYYGGGMKILPNAHPDDGLLDICIVEEISSPDFLRAFPGIFQGKHETHPRVRMLKAESIIVEADHSIQLLVDGEVLEGNSAKFGIIPNAVHIMAPFVCW